MERVITNKNELEMLLQHSKKVQFKFSFPAFTLAENEYWYKLISKHYKGCGCETGSVFIMIAFVLILGYLLFNWFHFGKAISLMIIINAFIFIIVSAVIGKLVGINIAKVRLRRKIKELCALV